MGSYKANNNQNMSNEANVVDKAANFAKKTPNIYAKAGGEIVSGLSKATGGRSSQMIGAGMKAALGNTPSFNSLNNKNNNFDNQNDEISNNDGKDTTKSNSNSTKQSFLSKGNKSKSSSDIGGKVWEGMPKALKIKIIICGGGALLFLMMVYAVFAQDDLYNLMLTNNTNISSTSGSRNCNVEEVENRLVYVGDSRIIGLQNTLNNENISYIKEDGSGYDWFKTTAISNIESHIQENPNSIIVLGLGINDLSNIDNYINAYKTIIEKYPNNKIYIMSVNPVDETKASTNNYNVTNSEIEEFNNQLSSNFPNNYIDSYNGLTNVNTTDGLHYDEETYKSLNTYITNNISSSGDVLCSVAGGDLIGKLEEVATWYISNVNTYQNSTTGKATGDRKMYQTPFGTRSFGDDCSEFAIAYMSYVAGTDLPKNNSAGMVHKGGDWAQGIATTGWIAYSTDEIDTLLPGDVLVANPEISYSKGHHAEVYIDTSTTFGWGSIKSSYPTNNTLTKSTKSNHTIYSDWVGKSYQHDYVTVYRYINASSSEMESN